MVIFAITRKGFEELESIIRTGRYSVWVGANILSEDEIKDLRNSKIDLTNFTYQFDPEDKIAIEEALGTIAEHHPNDRIWLECQPQI